MFTRARDDGFSLDVLVTSSIQCVSHRGGNLRNRNQVQKPLSMCTSYILGQHEALLDSESLALWCSWFGSSRAEVDNVSLSVGETQMFVHAARGEVLVAEREFPSRRMLVDLEVGVYTAPMRLPVRDARLRRRKVPPSFCSP